MQTVAWCIICPRGHVTLKLDHAVALQYARDHGGVLEALVLRREAIALAEACARHSPALPALLPASQGPLNPSP